jgi:hypothetical protein
VTPSAAWPGKTAQNATRNPKTGAEADFRHFVKISDISEHNWMHRRGKAMNRFLGFRRC